MVELIRMRQFKLCVNRRLGLHHLTLPMGYLAHARWNEDSQLMHEDANDATENGDGRDDQVDDAALYIASVAFQLDVG